MAVKERKYLTLDEAALYIKKKRATIYNDIRRLEIKTHKFPGDKKAYLALEDVKRMKEVRESPWIQEEA